VTKTREGEKRLNEGNAKPKPHRQRGDNKPNRGFETIADTEGSEEKAFPKPKIQSTEKRRRTTSRALCITALWKHRNQSCDGDDEENSTKKGGTNGNSGKGAKIEPNGLTTYLKGGPKSPTGKNIKFRDAPENATKEGQVSRQRSEQTNKGRHMRIASAAERNDRKSFRPYLKRGRKKNQIEEKHKTTRKDVTKKIRKTSGPAIQVIKGIKDFLTKKAGGKDKRGKNDTPSQRLPRGEGRGGGIENGYGKKETYPVPKRNVSLHPIWLRRGKK